MKILINRILFHTYYFHLWLNRSLYSIVRPISRAIGSHAYRRNLFNLIDKRNVSEQDYFRNWENDVLDLDKNLDYGVCMMEAQGIVRVILSPYITVVGAIVKRHTPLLGQLEYMDLALISIVISVSVAHFFSLRKDRFKLYFKEFKRNGRSLFWILITILLHLGMIPCILWSLVLWYN